MEPFLGKWKLDREFDENVEEYAEAEGVPLMMRKSFGKMEVNMIMEKADDEGKFDCKIKLGGVRKKTDRLRNKPYFFIRLSPFMTFSSWGLVM